MTKQEFITELRKKLCGLPEKDIDERIAFYIEMIDDRIEEGSTEADAVADIGSVDEIAAQIIADIPFTKIAKERIRPKKRLRAWEIVLLALGSPIWLSLTIAASAVILSLYVVIWSLAVSLWAIFASFVACAAGGASAGIVFIVVGSVFNGIAMIGAGIACAGLSIFMFFGSYFATKGIIILTKKIALGIKKCFVKKEEA